MFRAVYQNGPAAMASETVRYGSWVAVWPTPLGPAVACTVFVELAPLAQGEFHLVRSVAGPMLAIKDQMQ